MKGAGRAQRELPAGCCERRTTSASDELSRQPKRILEALNESYDNQLRAEDSRDTEPARWVIKQTEKEARAGDRHIGRLVLKMGCAPSATPLRMVVVPEALPSGRWPLLAPRGSDRAGCESTRPVKTQGCYLWVGSDHCP